jgi:outer membrane lipoprotein-sorting protein
MVRRSLLVAVLLMTGSCASAQQQSGGSGAPPLINPTGQQQQAQPGALNSNSSLDQILEALHQRGVGLKDFAGDVVLADMDALTGDTQTFTGKVWYQEKAPGDARIRVRFDKKQVGRRVDEQAKVEYMLDKGWLVERDFKRKLQVDRQVLKPGEKVNLLKLGEGPFPLPIGQPKEEVLKLFEVKQIPADKDDPQGTIHVQLVPKEGTQFARRFKLIDVWVDGQTHFPRRIKTLDSNQTEIKTTDLTNIQVNQNLGDQQFTLEKVEGWTVKSEAMEQ